MIRWCIGPGLTRRGRRVLGLDPASVAQLPFFFFFNDTATTEIYTLSLHDALPISATCTNGQYTVTITTIAGPPPGFYVAATRSEEHTSELQSPDHLVCRLLLEKKKTESTRKPAITLARREPTCLTALRPA